MMICRREKGQPFKKHGHYSSRSAWTKNDLIVFRTFLSMVMRPARPPRGRKQFLKLHPVCSGCKNEECATLSSDSFSVRCIQCVEKRKRCPRQIEFWVLSVAELMKKPTAVVAEMYELFGVEVRPKYSDRGSSTCSTTDDKDESDDENASMIFPVPDEDDSDEEDFSIELPASLIRKVDGLKKALVRFETPVASGSSIFEPGLTIRDRKRAREEGDEAPANRRAVKAKRTIEDDDLTAIVAKFAICRDKIRSAGRAFTPGEDERARRLMNVLEELDIIGEDFSEVVGDGNTVLSS